MDAPDTKYQALNFHGCQTQTWQIRHPIPFVENKCLIYVALVVISIPKPLLLTNMSFLAELHQIDKQETKVFREAGMSQERQD